MDRARRARWRWHSGTPARSCPAPDVQFPERPGFQSAARRPTNPAQSLRQSAAHRSTGRCRVRNAGRCGRCGSPPSVAEYLANHSRATTSKLFAARSASSRLHCLAVLARVNSVGQQLARSISAVAGIFQAHVRIDAKGQPLFLALEPVFQPPPSPAGRGDFQIKSAFVEQLEALLAGFGVPDRGIGQGTMGATPCGAAHLPLMLPPRAPDVNGQCCPLLNGKHNKKPAVKRASRCYWSYSE